MCVGEERENESGKYLKTDLKFMRKSRDKNNTLFLKMMTFRGIVLADIQLYTVLFQCGTFSGI